MPKYLSARRLGISTAEHRAMVQVVDLIAAVPMVPDDYEVTDGEGEPPTGTLFDMRLSAGATPCGTVACLGGHVGLVMAGVDLTEEFPRTTEEQREAAHRYVTHRSEPPGDILSRSVYALYYPELEVAMNATPVQARLALLNFLTTGEVDWPRALAEAPPPPGPFYGDPDHPYDPE